MWLRIQYYLKMREDTRQLGLRIPREQYNNLQDIAKARDISLTELIISIFDDFLNTNLPGLCPSCHTQNNPEARYCSNCASPLIEETEEEEKERYEDLLRRLEKMEKRFRRK